MARRGRPKKDPYREPTRSITRRTITEYVTLYRTRGGLECKVTTLTRPPKTKVMRTGHGRKKFIARKVKRNKKEIYIVARKKKDADVVTDEELEELEELDEELEEEDGDVEDADVVEDDDEDEDEEPAPKKKKAKAKKKQAPPTRETPADRGNIGTSEVAEEAGVDTRTLRMVLRKHKIAKDEETGRYEWSSLKHPEVKKILKLIEKGEADNIKQESLDKLKEKKAAEQAEKKKSKKSKKSKKKVKVPEPVDEDEDDEDEEEDEDDE